MLGVFYLIASIRIEFGFIDKAIAVQFTVYRD